jgi:hypothetical protein
MNEEIIEPAQIESTFVFNDFHIAVVYFMTIIIFLASTYVIFKMVKR